MWRRIRDLMRRGRDRPGSAVSGLGEISHEEAWFLGDLLAGLEAPGPIVEIGTLFGYSTRGMAERMSPDRRALSVDSYV